MTNNTGPVPNEDLIEQNARCLKAFGSIIFMPKLFLNDYFNEVKFQIDLDTEEFLACLTQLQGYTEADHQYRAKTLEIPLTKLDSRQINRRRDVMIQELKEHEKVLQRRLENANILVELDYFRTKHEKLKAQSDLLISLATTTNQNHADLTEVNDTIVYETNQAIRLLLNNQSFIFIERETINNFACYFSNGQISAKRWPFQGVLLNFKRLILEKENFM